MAQTKLLLVKDVEDLGKQGQIVKVRPGFARNFLLPKELGVIAHSGTVRMQERLQSEREKQAAVDRKDAEKQADKISQVVITQIVKVDQHGHMFGSVSAQDIRTQLTEEYGFELGKKAVQLTHPIKKTGVYTIALKLKEDVDASIQLKVVPDIVVEAPALQTQHEQKEESAPAEAEETV